MYNIQSVGVLGTYCIVRFGGWKADFWTAFCHLYGIGTEYQKVYNRTIISAYFYFLVGLL